MNKSYFLYQLYEKRGNQPFHPAYPVEYSVDGNGTMQKVIKKENDPNCNSVDNTIYQWVEVTGDYMCSGTTKCQKEKEQRSDDFGVTWTDTGNYRAGTVIEYNSEDCGYVEPQYRTVSGTPYCNGYTKMVDTYNQVSYDGGTTWENTGVSGSTVLAYDSPECGYPIYQWVDTDSYLCEYENEDVNAEKYLGFNILSGGTIVWRTISSFAYARNISYSLDSGTTWIETNLPTDNYGYYAYTINVNAGDYVMFKGENEGYSTGVDNCGFFNSTAYFNIEGNIMSLLYGDNFRGKDKVYSDNTFYGLFERTNAVNAENLVLPATTIGRASYGEMFYGCTSLITSPKILPSTRFLGESSYISMFSGCTSLITAPELPATILSDYCYWHMFQGCRSLTTAPELPATTLTPYCYRDMFNGCSGLTTAPELPATTLADYCYMSMFANCTGLTTAPELPATTLAVLCYSSMFYRCRSLTTAPELPATTLVNSCYSSMFEGCSNLNYIKCLATDVSATNCTGRWLYSVASRGTFVKASSMMNWSYDYNGIPDNWTIQNA